MDEPSGEEGVGWTLCELARRQSEEEVERSWCASDRQQRGIRRRRYPSKRDHAGRKMKDLHMDLADSFGHDILPNRPC